MNKFLIFILGCAAPIIMNAQKSTPYTIATLDPGHFHAALVQKSMYPNVSKDVYVYAIAGPDVDMHLKRIQDYNARKINPTDWNEILYYGKDFFSKMIKDKKANVVVLSGNNEKKSDYILSALQNGFHVLADKPMCIDEKGFEKIEHAFKVAEKNKLQLYDIMTERFEITSILQRILLQDTSVFGRLQKGTANSPAIESKNVHMLFKTVSGNVLTRPEWFLDAHQQGEGIADVMTHVIDLAQWVGFPNQIIDYKKDINVLDANHWPTKIELNQYRTLTHATNFAPYLSKNLEQDTVLNYYCNGDIQFQINGVYIKTTTLWQYQSADGSGDSYESIFKGTKSVLAINQGKAEGFKPTLYVLPSNQNSQFDQSLKEAIQKIQTNFPGIALEKINQGWKIIIPINLVENHEEHFAKVVASYLGYLEKNNMPAWETPNMLAKYYVATKALSIAKKKQMN